jgi:ABC-type multidrug transport system ATPase subunit
MPVALRARALWKSYAAGVAGCSARVWVLRGASLHVEEGECIAVLGARAAGTTTLLQCLAGLRRPDAGTIEHTLGARYVDTARGGAVAASEEVEGVLLYDDTDERDVRAWSWERPLLSRGRGAVIIATHELARVRELADRILLLRHGRLTELDRSAGLRRVAEHRVGRER